MEKRTREILALVLLVALGLAVSCAMGWYLVAGHNWNQAATRIDDMVGSMDGYTVIVYDGVAKPPKGKSSSSVRAATREYREKGAGVILLPGDCATRYDEPTILLRNGKRIGIFSFPGKYERRYVALRSYVRYLSRCEVDFVVCIADHKSMLKAPLSGIDLLIVDRNAGLPEGGELKGQALCVDSPYKGQVQAVIMAPSGVLTSRTIGEG